MNKVIISGNLTKDIEITTTSSGLSVARFTVAVQRQYTNQDGVYEADFINVVAWRTQAENCAKYLKKGSKVIVDGSIQIRNYEDDKGNKRYVTEIIADRVEFITPKATADQPNDSISKPKDPDLQPISDSDLPF